MPPPLVVRLHKLHGKVLFHLSSSQFLRPLIRKVSYFKRDTHTPGFSVTLFDVKACPSANHNQLHVSKNKMMDW